MRIRRPEIGAIAFTRAATWVLDFIAIGSLAGVPEIHPAVFLGVAVLFLLRLVTKLRFGDGVLTILLAILSSFSFGAYLVQKVPVVLAMAHGAPIFHALLWFAAVGTRDLWLRVSVGFVELILLAAMTAEFYLSVSLVIFVILASLMISCSLIRTEARPPVLDLGRPKPNRPPDPDTILPHSFLSHGVARSFVLMLLSLMIFPLLPRRTGVGDFVGSMLHVGYTEEVSVTGRKTLAGAGTGEPVMRLFLASSGGAADTGRLLTAIYLGLIRGRVLSEFDGVHWHPGVRSGYHPVKSVSATRPRPVTLEAIREPMTAVIPVPYGAHNLWRYGSGGFQVPERVSSGEWVDASAASSTIRYQFTIDDNDTMLGYATDRGDTPTDADYVVPTSVDTPRLQKLAARLMPARLDPHGKMEALASFFHASGFTATVSEDPTQDAIERNLRLTSLEKFLFASKSGHCELFSTSAAMLLRMAGVATRLVTGFRLSRGPSGGTLTIRAGDAHAWLEYYIPGHGWYAFDPTPRTLVPVSFFSYFRDVYENVSSIWYRYVFSYDTSRKSLFSMKGLQELRSVRFLMEAGSILRKSILANRDRILGISAGLAALLALAFLGLRTWFPWIFTIRSRVREGQWWVKSERLRMERLLRSRFGRTIDAERAATELLARGDPGAKALRLWVESYQEIRFGRVSEGKGVDRKQAVGELRRRYDDVRAGVKAA
jgi:hypothetical protein